MSEKKALCGDEAECDLEEHMGEMAHESHRRCQLWWGEAPLGSAENVSWGEQGEAALERSTCSILGSYLRNSRAYLLQQQIFTLIVSKLKLGNWLKETTLFFHRVKKTVKPDRPLDNI